MHLSPSKSTCTCTYVLSRNICIMKLFDKRNVKNTYQSMNVHDLLYLSRWACVHLMKATSAKLERWFACEHIDIKSIRKQKQHS